MIINIIKILQRIRSLRMKAFQNNIKIDNFYSHKDTLVSEDKLILASSGKKQIITLDHHIYDSTTVETGRFKSSYSKAETNCRSVASLIGNEESKSSKANKRRNLQNTPLGSKAKSITHFKNIVNSCSSKNEKRNRVNLILPNNIRTIPKQLNKYTNINSNKQLAQAYRSIPKDSIFSRRGTANKKTSNGTKRPKIPPTFNENTKDDQTLCLLLKHLKGESDSKLPNVNSYADFRTVSNFMNRHNRKQSSSRFLNPLDPQSLASTQQYDENSKEIFDPNFECNLIDKKISNDFLAKNKKKLKRISTKGK